MDIPVEFICPITQELMIVPVIASDGHTYESTAIKAWINGGHDTSPLTGAVLPNKLLIPNYNLKSLLQSFSEKKEDVNEGQISPQHSISIEKTKDNVQKSENEEQKKEMVKEVGAETATIRTVQFLQELGLYSGYCRVYTKDEIFEGEAVRGFLVSGSLQWRSKRNVKYEGELRDFTLHGKGRYTFEVRTLKGVVFKKIFTGNFYKDHFEGSGTLLDVTTGDIIKGVWSHTLRADNVTLYCADGRIVQGSLRGFKFIPAKDLAQRFKDLITGGKRIVQNDYPAWTDFRW